MFTFTIKTIDRLTLENGKVVTVLSGADSGTMKSLVLSNGKKEIKVSCVYTHPVVEKPVFLLQLISGDLDDSDIGTTFFEPA